VPTVLSGFPSAQVRAVFGIPNICANGVSAPAKQMLLADIWRNGDAVNSFPSVRDVAISIQLKNTANMGLVALLEKDLEQLSEFEEYRIYTHAFPSGRSNQDWIRGRCTINVTWVSRTLYEGKLQWKARVTDTTQWGTMYPVWLLYGED
jgi:hypothetical protein